ncbi:MAG: ABC-2 transporter permease [Lachnospiraceae bacterium]|nr:ABC-2 transporter permease [Lachnospiraceae bacterium]
MGGLLYKDFVSVNRINKVKLTWILAALTILYIGLRIAFPGTADMEMFLAENEKGEIVNLMDTFFLIALGLFIVGTLGLMNGWVARLVETDDKNKIRGYISALPLDKNAYIASKYIFMAVSAYVFMSIYYIWCISCLAFCREGVMANNVEMIGGFIPVFISFMLLLAAIELPLFILLGKEKAMLIKIAFIMLIAFAFIGFVLFGDLLWVEQHIDMIALTKWYKTHMVEMAIVVLLSPVLVLALYYGSYRITCHFAGKEDKS